MKPVTSQPGVDHRFMFPSPPTPPQRDNASFDYGPGSCLDALTDGGFYGMIGAGVGSLLEVAATGAVASAHLPLGLCCAFGFSCFSQSLNNHSLEKKRQLDHAYLQDLQTYNVQLRERVVMLLAESSHLTATAEDRQQVQIADKLTDTSQAA